MNGIIGGDRVRRDTLQHLIEVAEGLPPIAHQRGSCGVHIGVVVKRPCPHRPARHVAAGPRPRRHLHGLNESGRVHAAAEQHPRGRQRFGDLAHQRFGLAQIAALPAPFADPLRSHRQRQLVQIHPERGVLEVFNRAHRQIGNGGGVVCGALTFQLIRQDFKDVRAVKLSAGVAHPLDEFELMVFDFIWRVRPVPGQYLDALGGILDRPLHTPAGNSRAEAVAELDFAEGVVLQRDEQAGFAPDMRQDGVKAQVRVDQNAGHEVREGLGQQPLELADFSVHVSHGLAGGAGGDLHQRWALVDGQHAETALSIR